MPFTVSHVVAVVPLYKYLGRFGAFSALIIGSMVPDFAYMTPFLVDHRMDSHSLLGIYLYGIPMGLTVYFLYHFFMAPVIVSLLPEKISKHLSQNLFLGRPPDIPAHILVFSIIVGALTHIFWDFFTHENGIPVYIDWFNIPLTSIDGYEIMPFRVLQHFSTIFGLCLLVFLIWIWLSKRKQKTESIAVELQNKPIDQGNIWKASSLLKKISLIIILTVPLLSGIVFAIYTVPQVDDVMFGLYKAQFFLRYGIVSAAAMFIISTALIGVVYKFLIYRHDQQALTAALQQ